MRKLIAALLAVCMIIGLSACKSRDSRPQSSSAEPSPPPEIAVSIPQPIEAPPPEVSEPSSSPEIPAITDAEKIAEATAVVTELFDRARVADELFRAQIRRDSMVTQVLDNQEYSLVMDERFAAAGNVRDWWVHTFTTGGAASARFEELQAAKVYVSMNGELWVISEPRKLPMTMGAWKLSTLEVLRFDELELEVRMEATLLGAPEGKKTLRIVKNGDSWLLGDSYFLD